MYQTEELKDAASEMQRDLARLQNMYHDTLSILYERNILALMKENQVVNRLKKGCTRRYQLAEKMILNQLQDIEEESPYGHLLRQAFLKRVQEMLSKGGHFIEAEEVKEVIAKFLDSVEKGINIWKDKRVVEDHETKPLDEAKVNYMMSLLNKGMIESDRREAIYKQTGKAEDRDMEALYQRAEKKLQRELGRIERKEPSEAGAFRSLFERGKDKKEELDFT